MSSEDFDVFNEFAVPTMPVREVEDESRIEGKVLCSECNKAFDDENAFVVITDGDFYCDDCVKLISLDVAKEARADALENCKITVNPPRFDPELEYAPTPEQYESGDKYAYTENSHLCFCRHNCTNYDELIKPLDQFSLWDQIWYRMIRRRIEELLEVEIDKQESSRDEAADE